VIFWCSPPPPPCIPLALPYRYGEAVALINLGMALRGMRKAAAAAHLQLGRSIAREMGFSRLSARSDALHAQFVLEKGKAADLALGDPAALEQLRRAARVSEANERRRTAFKDTYNVLLAEMRWGRRSLLECCSRLETLEEDAQKRGDASARICALAAIGLARLGRRGGSVGRGNENNDGLGFNPPPDPCAALPPLLEAMQLAVAVGDVRVRSEVAAMLSLCHLLQPCALVAAAERAVVCARDAKAFGEEDRGGIQAPHELTQLGVALVATIHRKGRGASALQEARVLLMAAVDLSRQQGLKGAEAKVEDDALPPQGASPLPGIYSTRDQT